MRKFYLLISFSLIWLTNACFGQTSAGKDFWLGYPEVSDLYGTNCHYTVKITSLVNTSGTITIPGQGFSQNFTVSPGIVTSIVLPSASVVDSSSDVLKNVAVEITSLDDIRVFAFTMNPQRNSSMLILPVSVMGSDYYVLSNKDFAPGSIYDLSEFMIVSQGSSATVKITTTVATRGGHPAGVPYTVTLAPGQVYQVQALKTGDPSTGTTGDLTGSRVVAANGTDKFGVIGANEFAQIGCSGTGEPFAAEMFPLNLWGKEFVFVPLPPQSDICRVFASQNSTKVYINGTLKSTLNAGNYYEQSITSASFICADKPVQVARYLKTSACNNDGSGKSLGDASMVIVHPNSQMYLDSVSFDATRGDTVHQVVFGTDFYPKFRTDTIMLQIITRTADINKVYLDGVNMGPSFATLASNTAYSYTATGVNFSKLNGGNFSAHTLTTTGSGFLGYITGQAYVSNYLYSIGVKGILTRPDSILVSPGNCYTVGDTVQFACINSLLPQSWSWNFGDTKTSTSANPKHVYSTTGKKIVSLTLTFSCFSETLTDTLNVCPVAVPIKLIDFNSKVEKSNVLLNWTTATEINNDYFIVERSMDAEKFSAIGKVKGVGHSLIDINYLFKDNEPRVGDNYYRLKQIDFDGQISYSRVVLARFMSNARLRLNSITPIPAKEKVTVSFNVDHTGFCFYTLYDITGRKIKSELFNEIESGINVKEIDLTPFKSGVYFLSLEKDGERIISKLIKF